MNRVFKSVAVIVSVFVLSMSYTMLYVPSHKLTNEEIIKLGFGYASAIGVTAYAFSNSRKEPVRKTI